LAEAGRREQALTLSEEAVTLRRQLAQANPDAYLPDLAGSVGNHALRLAEAGRREQALTLSEEAVTLRRQLAQANPDAYLPDLARALWMAGYVRRLLLTDLSEAEINDGVRATQEAVDIYTKLANAEPEAFAADLAATLQTLTDLRAAHGSTAV
jgi:hypothetical protein